MKRMILIAILGGVAGVASAADYFVATNGVDTHAGTSVSSPFKTISKAASVMGAGDTCYIRGGTYYEVVAMNNKVGSSSSPITFSNYQDETVTLTGAQSLSDLGSTGWTLHSGNIYKTVLNTDIWQLFDGSTMMIPARWPNANFDDGSIWNQAKWGYGNDSTSSNGTQVDAPHDGISLSATGLDMTGAMAVLNVGSWKTWTSEVNSHAAGSGTFFYDTVPTHLGKQNSYFLECKLNLLDTEKEWFFDSSTKTLYLWAEGGGVPSVNIQAKTQDYAFNVTSSKYVTLDGLDFFGTTINFNGTPYTTIRDCDFLYPSCAKRMLGSTAAPKCTTVYQSSGGTTSYSTFFNCTFRYAEGEAVKMKGRYDSIENCLFEYNDWSASELDSLMATVQMAGDDSVFRRNTSRMSGASQVIAPLGARFLGELNDMSQYGELQHDGAAFQIMIPFQPGVELRYNWMYNAEQLGIRFDAPIPPTVWGENGLVHHNVGWKTSAFILLKGVDHFCYNNIGFANSINDIIILDDTSAWIGTETYNNMGKISGSRSKDAAIPGPDSNNWNEYVTGKTVESQLQNTGQLDFRPIASSATIDGGKVVSGITDGYIGSAPDIGVYELGNINYWIPGHQLAAATQPMPSNRSGGFTTDRDLIWLGGLEGTSFDVYFGNNNSAVAAATRSSSEFKGNQSNNIFMPDYSSSGRDCYWRIDTLTPVGTVKGTVWDYQTTLPVAVAPVANAGSDQTVTDADGSGSESITLDGSGSTDSDGTITNYAWTEGGTEIATGIGPVESLTVGTHTITLTVTDNDGTTGTDTVFVHVRPLINTPPLAAAGADQSVTLSASAPWTPADITTEAWYDASDATTITTDVLNQVSQWGDKSGNNNDASQATGSKQPSTGSLTINGLNVLGFSGGAKILNTSLTQLTTASIYFVADVTAKDEANNNNCPLGAATAYNSGGLYITLQNSSSGAANNTAIYTTGVPVYLDGVLDEVDHGFTPSIFSHQGTSLSTDSLAYRIGASLTSEYVPYSGSIGEIIICPEDHTQATRQKVEGYLAWKWGLEGNLPIGHPYKTAAPGIGTTVTLDGTISDDDDDPLSSSWSVVGTPATVTIANTAAVDTTATFTEAGVYTLRLEADDGIDSTSDDVTITVTDGSGGIIDTDADGIEDSWEELHFENLDAADKTTDNDGDGFIDLNEYLAGTSPTNSASLLVVSSVAPSVTPGEYVITWQAVATRRYSVLQNTNLLDLTWTTNASRIQGIEPLCTHTVQTENAKTFYRIAVEE